MTTVSLQGRASSATTGDDIETVGLECLLTEKDAAQGRRDRSRLGN